MFASRLWRSCSTLVCPTSVVVTASRSPHHRNAISARLAMPSATLAGAKFYAWDTMSGAIEWYDAVKGCTGVVNLAGAPIANPWNESYKKTLVKSRLQATKRVSDAINALPESERPSLVSSSAARVAASSVLRSISASPMSKANSSLGYKRRENRLAV